MKLRALTQIVGSENEHRSLDARGAVVVWQHLQGGKLSTQSNPQQPGQIAQSAPTSRLSPPIRPVVS